MTDSVNDARATEEVVGDDPPVSDSATGGAPNDGTAHVPSSEAGDEQQVHDDQVATASAAAAAVAARLMASHGQAPYAVSVFS